MLCDAFVSSSSQLSTPTYSSSIRHYNPCGQSVLVYSLCVRIDVFLRRNLMATAAGAPLPVLLPSRSLPTSQEGRVEWTPKRNLEVPNSAPPEDPRMLEMDLARQLADGKPVKKVRPRRTVDYGGAMGRWTLVRSNTCFCFTPR